MKKFGAFLLVALSFCILLNGCGTQKEVADHSQKTDVTAQSQKTESQTEPLPTTSLDENTLPTVSDTPNTSESEAVDDSAISSEASAPPITQQPSPKLNINVNDVLVIGEKMFLTQINDIFYNFDQYRDKTIVVEGMYTLFFNQDGVQDTPAVYRRGPGCCGNDGWGGFLLKYDGDYPEDNAWIKVTGTPELVENGYFKDLWLNVTSIEVLEERGEEFVSQ